MTQPMQDAEIEIDPIRYEMFVHRLLNIAEEGRIALQKVCASPIVVQGGECMASFYEADGRTIMSASGHLRFSAGCEDAVKKVIEYCSDNPGIFDGDQFFMNDPYIASTHVYDEMIVKPIFANGELIAWTASMTHTADTGGMLRGGSTEIFHEGVRSFGIKLMERGRLRADVFRDLTGQCRDPEYVGLDLKSRIASNNVCARGFLQLVEKYGLEFVRAACRKLNRDSARMARGRLESLPDGTWCSRLFGSSVDPKSTSPHVFTVACRMTKAGESIVFDFAGTSPQSSDSCNSTYVGSWGQLFVALTSQLFWHIPWNSGMTEPVTLKIPEGTLLNCRYPAACAGASFVGTYLTAAASACIAKMLYAAGLYEDVNASSYGGVYAQGPGFMYGGQNQQGRPVGQGIYDMHASGFGAAPYRDGVSSGGHQNNPTVGISDIENIEMQYPLMYLSRNHMIDSGGFGKFRGGLGLQRIVLSRGGKNLTVDYAPYHGVPGGWGLFGGYPGGICANSSRLDPSDLVGAFKSSRYPVELRSAHEWGDVYAPELPPLTRLPFPEGSIIFDPVMVGSGFGDPLDRAPGLVMDDILNQAVSEKLAGKIYGVILDAGGQAVDEGATEASRRAKRAARLAAAHPVNREKLRDRRVSGAPVIRPHEYVEVVADGSAFTAACRCCQHDLGPATANYKEYSVSCVVDKDDLTEISPPGGRKSLGCYVEYYCPGCGTLLDVETHCAMLEGEKFEPLWDIRIDLAVLANAAHAARPRSNAAA